MKGFVKPTQLPRAGYVYQDLLGLELLFDWYRNPTKLDWVRLECSDLDGRKIPGLDDIVGQCSDGSWVLLQSKFTIDPDRDDLALSLDWLLDKPTHVQKWAKTLLELLASGEKVDARLKTNRIPDQEISELLDDGFIRPDKMSSEVLVRFSKKIGSDAEVRNFCGNFRIDHSLPILPQLEEDLYLDLISQGKTELDWLRFSSEIRRWSMMEGYPLPDGVIRISHLNYLLDSGKSKPIPQGFFIPEGYIPPDTDFDDQLMTRISADGITVIWGSPGLGKSTYLSYFCQENEKAHTPVVRHHYYLSQRDKTPGRWWFDTAAGSMINQLSFWFPDDVDAHRKGPSELRQVIEACAQRCGEADKKLVLIVDGLDHVWREQSDSRQLFQLFDNLLPLPQNVHLLVGTQMVPDEQLSTKLLTAVPKNQWLELPQMNLTAIEAWLSAQKIEEADDDEITRIGEAFLEVSAGHPLYLIYSFEYLFRTRGRITAYEVEGLPPCPDNDINKYYGQLWQRLPLAAKEILHLCASSEFHWPDENSICSCFGNAFEFVAAFNEIGHLLRRENSGLTPFHGSIYVYIKNRSDHSAASQRLLPLTQRWLQDAAPPYWRWGWAWIIDAKLGTTEPLIEGPSRSWVIDGWIRGYPLAQMVSIFEAAERAALDAGRYDRLVELRTIKIRMQNSVEFQRQAFGEFEASALAMTDDNYGINLLTDNIRELPEDSLLMLSRLMCERRPEVSRNFLDEQNRFVKHDLRSKDHNWSETSHSYDTLARLAALAHEAPGKKIILYLSQFRSQGSHYARSFMMECLSAGLASRCLRIEFNGESITKDDGSEKSVHPSLVYQLGTGVVRAACIEDVQLDQRPDLRWVTNLPLGRCWFAMKGKNDLVPDALKPTKIPDSIGFTDYEGPFLHDHFFSVLAEALTQKENFEPIQRVVEKDENANHEKTFCVLNDAAVIFATRLRSRAGTFDPLALYVYLEANLKWDWSNDHKKEEARRALLVSLPEIAFDLAFLAKTIGFSVSVSPEAIEKIQSNSWWGWESWSSHMINIGWPHFSPEATERMIDVHTASFDEGVDYFSTLADNYVSLAKLAMHGDLTDKAMQMLLKAAPCYLGYGWRKDTAIFDVFNAIGYCGDHGIDVRHFLERVEPINLSILEFTDGKETSHAPGEYLDLVKRHAPDRVMPLYIHYQENEEWFYADAALERVIEVGDFSDPAFKALAKTVTTDSALRKMKSRVEEGEKAARELYEKQVQLVGCEPGPEPKFEGSHPEIGIDIDFAKFLPSEFNNLIAELNGKSSLATKKNRSINDRKYVREWFQYWRSEGRASDLLELATPWLDNEDLSGDFIIGSCLGEAFEASMKIEGKEAAYKWMLLDHIRNQGWSSYYSHRVEERTRRAAEVYKDRWQQFILDTSIPHDDYNLRRYGLSVGREYLVCFLLEVDQHDLAIAVTEAMVSSLEDDVSPLELKRLPWNDESASV